LKPAIVLLAAGSGSRFGQETNKVWLPLAGKSIISRTISNAHKAFPDAPKILVINPDDKELAVNIINKEMPDIPMEIIPGGTTRHGSEYQALVHLAKDIESANIDVVLIHDGARPLATPDSLSENCASSF
jgi:2-C-methyl-D-erythritol 4-phosphate cytidylyltransferase